MWHVKRRQRKNEAPNRDFTLNADTQGDVSCYIIHLMMWAEFVVSKIRCLSSALVLSKKVFLTMTRMCEKSRCAGSVGVRKNEAWDAAMCNVATPSACACVCLPGSSLELKCQLSVPVYAAIDSPQAHEKKAAARREEWFVCKRGLALRKA